MTSRWLWRGSAGVAAALAVACGGSLDSNQSAVLTAQADEPPAAAPALALANTGNKPQPGFILDLSKRFDEASEYLSDYEMDADWIKIVYRPRNVEFGKNGMVLNLLKTHGEKLPFSGSEFQKTGYYGYGRYEAVLTATDGHGTVSSFFTYTGEQPGDLHDEIDFEFMGRDPRKVHLNYFNDGKDDPLDVPLWFDAAEQDHLYAFEWSPTSIRWMVDGQVVREVDARNSAVGIPDASSHVIANIWAAAGESTRWVGEPNFTHAKAHYRCISHVPAGKVGPQCGDNFTPPARP